jgi:hypothetical protein
MKQYKTLTELYLTFITHNDSYMEKIPVGTVLEVLKDDLCYNGKPSIDDYWGLLHYKHIEEIK